MVTGLPSLAAEDGSSVFGLHDISPDGPGLVATIGGAYDLGTRTLLGPGARLMGHIVSLHPGVRGGAVKPIADLNAYEEAKSPNQGDPGSLIGSNPYGILATPFGAFATDRVPTTCSWSPSPARSPQRRSSTASHHPKAPTAHQQPDPSRMNVRALPIGLPPVSRETLGSYLHRLADANHITIAAIIQLLDINRRYRRGDDDPTNWTAGTVIAFAALAAQPSSTLTQALPALHAFSTVGMNGTASAASGGTGIACQCCMAGKGIHSLVIKST
ncbi:hypothetical protein ACQP00_21065 [Dactylosporangium sp. CS-047395]|uniref:hypothetical protein n=1 Tax=Dactylosporangium sp. CS-047395 TaxID=3239936 RepID=UPI003D8BFFD9